MRTVPGRIALSRQISVGPHSGARRGGVAPRAAWAKRYRRRLRCEHPLRCLARSGVARHPCCDGPRAIVDPGRNAGAVSFSYRCARERSLRVGHAARARRSQGGRATSRAPSVERLRRSSPPRRRAFDPAGYRSCAASRLVASK